METGDRAKRRVTGVDLFLDLIFVAAAVVVTRTFTGQRTALLGNVKKVSGLEYSGAPPAFTGRDETPGL
jgi:hypothetical protein